MKTSEGRGILGNFWWRGEHAGVQLAFTVAAAGNLSRSVGVPGQGLENRRALEADMGLEPGQLRFLNQVHSADVLDADVGRQQSLPLTGDAWISTEGTPIAVLVADCLPVLFVGFGADGRVLTAAAHAGRPGLIAGVLERTVAALRGAGAEAITGWIGPGACGECYEVPQAMFDELTATRPALASATSWGTPALDLRAEATAALSSAGVQVSNEAGGCTIEDRRLFSHRRCQKTGEPVGRLAGLVWTQRR